MNLPVTSLQEGDLQVPVGKNNIVGNRN
jgi:hypothetical protein